MTVLVYMYMYIAAMAMRILIYTVLAVSYLLACIRQTEGSVEIAKSLKFSTIAETTCYAILLKIFELKISFTICCYTGCGRCRKPPGIHTFCNNPLFSKIHTHTHIYIYLMIFLTHNSYIYI